MPILASQEEIEAVLVKSKRHIDDGMIHFEEREKNLLFALNNLNIIKEKQDEKK